MNRRSTTLILCLIVIVVLGVLAASLPDAHFEPGRSIAAPAGSPSAISLPDLDSPSNTSVWKLLLLWLVFVINLSLLFLLLPPEARKRVLRQVISLALGMLALLLALRYRMIHLPQIEAAPAESSGAGIGLLAAAASAPSFQRPQPSPWMTYLISLLVLWGVLLGGWLLYRWWKRRFSPRGSLTGIAEIARSSLSQLGSGGQWGDVIIEAYARMSDAVRAQRGLQRAAAATAREFAGRLTQAGLPSESVAGLTRLFESARYGERIASERDKREAVACLESILRACGVEA
jgi:hypothetical protein